MVHRIYDAVAGMVLICSLLYSVLPPYDGYGDFPRFQKFYKAFIFTIGHMGANARSSLYPSIPASNKLPSETKTDAL